MELNTELESMYFIVGKIILILLETLYLFILTMLHHHFKKYLERLPRGFSKLCVSLLGDLFLLSNFFAVLPLIAANVYLAFQHVRHIFA